MVTIIKNKNARILIIVLLAIIPAMPALAIWGVGDPSVMHFPQLPDISEAGLHILATPTALAENFRSSQTALLTNIILWGGWLDDHVGPLDLNVALFSNLPAGAGNIPYSRPGELLWFRFVSATEIEATGIAPVDIPLYDASLNEVIGLAATVIQYDISIDPNEAFWLQADSIYWLSIQRPDADDGNIFGWMSSFSHFEGSAVFEYVPEEGGQSEIRQLLYPITHQYVGQGIDMAFVIATSVPMPNEGNFDGDEDVDFADFAILSAAWLTEDGQEGWNPDCDISSPADSIIDMLDLVEFVEHWGQEAE